MCLQPHETIKNNTVTSPSSKTTQGNKKLQNVKGDLLLLKIALHTLVLLFPLGVRISVT